MGGRLARIGAAAGLALALLGTAPPALAQAPDARAAADHIAHELMSAIDFQAAVMKGAQTQAKALGGLDQYRPEWSKFALDALNEEIAVSGPALERVISVRLAKAFTLDELKAGEVIISDPITKSVIAAGSRGEDVKTSSCGSDCMRTLSRPAGQSFMRKLGNADAIFGKDAQGDMVAAIMPGFMRRWADKIEAAEKARGG